MVRSWRNGGSATAVNCVGYDLSCRQLRLGCGTHSGHSTERHFEWLGVWTDVADAAFRFAGYRRKRSIAPA